MEVLQWNHRFRVKIAERQRGTERQGKKIGRKKEIGKELGT